MNRLSRNFAVAAAIAAVSLASPAQASEDGWWQRFESVPLGRMLHASVYAHDAIYVYGGLHEPWNHQMELLNDLWRFGFNGVHSNPVTLVRVATTGPTPPGGGGHSLIHDPLRDRIVLFADGEVWVFPAHGSGEWRQIGTAGPSPGARYGAIAVYDPVRDRMVVFGGLGHVDTWAFTFEDSTWTEIVTMSTPDGGDAVAAAYDPVRDRLVMFGGDNGSFWTWMLPFADGSDWEAYLSGNPNPGDGGARTMVYDPETDRMILHGESETWALTLAGAVTWTELSNGGTPPDARGFHTAVYSTFHQRMFVIGGSTSTRLLNLDLWRYNISSETWDSFAVRRPPGITTRVPAVYDPSAGPRMLVHDGYHLYGLDLVGMVDWGRFSTNVSPSFRTSHTLVRTSNGRLVLFGGRNGAVHLNDVWIAASPVADWVTVTPAGTPPPPRAGHTAILDAANDRMIVFGGHDGTDALADAWSLSLTGTPTWTPLPSLPAAGRWAHSAIYDPWRQRMLVHGGRLTGSFTASSEVWEFAFDGAPTWSLLAPGGPARFEHSAIYEPGDDRMVVFGGDEGDNENMSNAAFALDLQTQEWSQLVPEGEAPHPRWGHAAIYFPMLRKMVVFGGSWVGPYDPPNTYVARSFNDAHTLSWTSTGSVLDPRTDGHRSVVAVVPNPGSRGQTIELNLGAAARSATVEILDVSGRRVWSRTLSGASGRQRVVWDGSDRDGARVPAGVYFARVQGARAACRFARIE